MWTFLCLTLIAGFRFMSFFMESTYAYVKVLDETFGDNGISLYSISNKGEWTCGIKAIQDGGYIIVGTQYDSGFVDTSAYLKKFKSDGSIDSSFGTN